MFEVAIKFIEALPPTVQRLVVLLFIVVAIVHEGTSLYDKQNIDHIETVNQLNWLKGHNAKTDSHFEKIDDALLKLSNNEAAIAQFDVDTAARLHDSEGQRNQPRN